MSDFDAELRAAVTGAAQATVAPPFAAVERRARARRLRQVGAVAAAVVAVVAAGALAVPGGEPRTAAPAATASPSPSASPSLKPNEDFAGDPAANAVFDACMAEREKVPSTFPDKMRRPTDETACFAEAGYQSAPPSRYFDDARDNTENGMQCVNVRRPGTDGTRTLAEGRAGGHHWFITTWDSYLTHQCVGWSTRPQQEPLRFSSRNDSGPLGEPQPVLSWDYLLLGDDAEVVLWGALPREVVRVEVTAGEATLTLETVRDRDRSYVGALIRVPDGAKPERAVGYDAAGGRVELPALSR